MIVYVVRVVVAVIVVVVVVAVVQSYDEFKQLMTCVFPRYVEVSLVGASKFLESNLW